MQVMSMAACSSSQIGQLGKHQMFDSPASMVWCLYYYMYLMYFPISIIYNQGKIEVVSQYYIDKVLSCRSFTVEVFEPDL